MIRVILDIFERLLSTTVLFSLSHSQSHAMQTNSTIVQTISMKNLMLHNPFL